MKGYFLRDGGKLKKFGQKNKAKAALAKFLGLQTKYADISIIKI